MARKTRNPNFDQTLSILRAHSFDIAPYADTAGAVLVSKHGAAAVLVPTQGTEAETAPVTFAERPGALAAGQVARLLTAAIRSSLRPPNLSCRQRRANCKRFTCSARS